MADQKTRKNPFPLSTHPEFQGFFPVFSVGEVVPHRGGFTAIFLQLGLGVLQELPVVWKWWIGGMDVNKCLMHFFSTF